jgi:Tfp pilus assembly PilM family ATPase
MNIMSDNVTTVQVDDSNLRLLVMRGKRIRRRATLPLEPGLVESAVVLKEDEVANRLKEFMREKDIKAKKVIVGVSGLHNITRPLQLPKLEQSLIAEAVVREAKRVLPIAADQFYIMWQPIPSSEGRTDVFVSAIRCTSADSIVRMLKKAGLSPVAMDLKPLALSRLVKEKTAIILDVQSTEFDIIVLSDGVPQPVRTVPMPAEARSWPQKLELLKTELERTIDFFNTTYPDKVLDANIPLHISGELTSQPELLESLPQELGHPVVPLSSRLKSARDADYNNYMTNVGLAMLDQSLVKRAGPSVATSNLLPAVYRPKPVSFFRIAALPSGVTIVALLAAMLLLTQAASANISSMRSQLETTDRLIKQEIAKKSELNQSVIKTEAENKKYQSALDALSQQHLRINGDLDTAMSKMPTVVRLVSIDDNGTTRSITGICATELDVLTYASALEKSGRFSQVIVSKIKVGDKDPVRFTLTLQGIKK